MKKSALFTAAVPAVFSVALSLSMLACSDDAPAVAPVLGGGEIASSDSDQFNSSSAGSDKSSSSAVRSGFQLGACKRNAFDALAKDASVDETRKAYLVNDSTGTHVVLPDVRDYCGYLGEVTYSKKRSGDTLIIVKNDEQALPTNCLCIYDFSIDLDVADMSAKYVRYGNVYEVVTDPLPESSSSVKSSSSEASVSCLPGEFCDEHQVASDIVAACNKNSSDAIVVDTNASANDLSDLVVRLDELENSSKTSSVARKYVGDDNLMTIVIDKVVVGCGVTVGDLDVSASGDTLYVDPINPSALFATNCVCPTRLSFKIKKNSQILETKYLVFNHNEGSTYLLMNGAYGAGNENKVVLENGISRGECRDYKKKSQKTDATTLPLATLVYHPERETYIELFDVQDYCSVGKMTIAQKRNGDTLFVDYYNTDLTECTCTIEYHQIRVARGNEHVGYLSFQGMLFKVEPLIVD
jgi:hypothetical protein